METNNAVTTDTILEPYFLQEGPVPPAAHSSHTAVGVLIALVMGLGLLLVCALSLAAVFWPIIEGYGEQDQILHTVDQFNRHMVNRDTDAAYALFSPRAKGCFDRADLDNMVKGANYSLFEGYQRVEMTDLTIENHVSSGGCEAQGLRAWVTGVITYRDGYQGTFEAGLERVNGEWYLDSVNVSVPPEKIHAIQDSW